MPPVRVMGPDDLLCTSINQYPSHKQGTPARVFGCCLCRSPVITLTAVNAAGDDDDGFAPASLGRECSNLLLPPNQQPPS
eukprot:9012233-Prorocentrum_lima.AAC.1